MQLKTKGRFILETALFEGAFNKQPSTDSQRKVVSSLIKIKILLNREEDAYCLSSFSCHYGN